jgi:hypothetical protein
MKNNWRGALQVTGSPEKNKRKGMQLIFCNQKLGGINQKSGNTRKGEGGGGFFAPPFFFCFVNELWNVILNSRKSFLFFLKKRGIPFNWGVLKDHKNEKRVWVFTDLHPFFLNSEHIHYEIWFFLFLFLRMRLGLERVVICALSRLQWRIWCI